MRKWAAEHPVLSSALFAILVGVVVLIVDILLGRKLDTAIANTVFWMLFFWGSSYFAQKRTRKTKARLDEHGQSLMFLRYPDSRPGSLSGVWQMGVATPAPGRIDFQPVVYEDLVPTGRSRALTGLHSVPSPPRKADRHDNKQAVPYGFQIINMDSDGGPIEIAASPDVIRKIQDDVAPASP